MALGLLLALVALAHDDARTEALAGSNAPTSVLKRQALVEVEHLDYEGRRQRGTLVVDASLAKEVREIFAELLDQGFRIEKVRSASAYRWDDLASMKDNNTSGFNYRKVEGTRRLSNHASGRAIDINPMQNPHIGHDRTGAVYDREAPGTLAKGSAAVRAFEKRGWTWGGKWRRPDHMHFEKP